MQTIVALLYDTSDAPVAIAVAVAMAGMILPAISFAFNLSTSAMP